MFSNTLSFLSSRYAIISQIYFLKKSPNISDISSVHHQEFFTVRRALVYVIQLAGRIRTELTVLASCQHIYHCYVYSEILLMMDRGADISDLPV